MARRGSDKRGSGEIGRNRVWLEQGCGRTLIDKLGSSLSLLGDIFRIDLEEEMRSWPLGLGPGPGPGWARFCAVSLSWNCRMTGGLYTHVFTDVWYQMLVLVTL